MKTKEIKSAGFCIVRHELVNKNLRIRIGGTLLSVFQERRPFPYRWLADDIGFQIRVNNRWEDAESIDFDFLDTEKEITKKHFNGYRDTRAKEEIEDWSAKDLKEFIRLCGYKYSYPKDILTSMVWSLVCIHIFTNHLKIEKNPFLVK